MNICNKNILKNLFFNNNFFKTAPEIMGEFVKHHYGQKIRFHRFRTHCFTQYCNKLVCVLLDSNFLGVARLRKLFYYMGKIKTQHEDVRSPVAYLDYRMFIFFTYSKTPDTDVTYHIRDLYFDFKCDPKWAIEWAKTNMNTFINNENKIIYSLYD